MNEHIKVDFEVHANRWHIAKSLEELAKHKVLSFDTETAGVYTKAERAEAKAYLKNNGIPLDMKIFSLQVAENSGLSFPSLSSTTHFIFGTSESSSVILVCDNPMLEMFIWNWVAEYNGLLIIHNALFDLKIMYHRIGRYPKNYEDSQLLAKCLTNNVEVWSSKVGLKDLMGSYYDPSWAILTEEYEPDDLRNPKFIKYCSIDGAATFKLWIDIQGYMGTDYE
jgi:hypothetical protein